MTCQGGLGDPLPGPDSWVRWEEKPQLLYTRNFSPRHKCKRTEVLPGESRLQGQQGAGSRSKTQVQLAWGTWGADLPLSVDATLGPRAGVEGRRCWCFHPRLAPHQPSANSLLRRTARSIPANCHLLAPDQPFPEQHGLQRKSFGWYSN